MTNRNSHGHGTKATRAKQPKSKIRKRLNKENARAASAARTTTMREALAKGN